MAVRSSRASESAQTGPESPQGPIRTCIGCRKRAPAAELLRVVVAPESTGTSGPVQYPAGTRVPVVPDPRHRASGRGAWLHHDPGCVDLAQRRRAFARALRVPGQIDPTPVHEYVTESAHDLRRNPAGAEGE